MHQERRRPWRRRRAGNLAVHALAITNRLPTVAQFNRTSQQARFETGICLSGMQEVGDLYSVDVNMIQTA